MPCSYYNSEALSGTRSLISRMRESPSLSTRIMFLIKANLGGAQSRGKLLKIAIPPRCALTSSDQYTPTSFERRRLAPKVHRDSFEREVLVDRRCDPP